MDKDPLLPLLIAGAIVMALVAVVHDNHRRGGSPSTKPYIWGYFTGYLSVAFGIFFLLAGVVGLASKLDKSTEAAQAGTFLMLWGGAFVASGVGIVARRNWAWILRICLWPNIVTIIINIVYYRRRAEELRSEQGLRVNEHFAQPAVAVTPPPLPTVETNSELMASSQSSEVLTVTKPHQRPVLGGLALGVALVAGTGLFLLILFVVAASANQPDIWDNETFASALLGLLLILLGVANFVNIGLCIASFMRSERPFAFALGGLVVSTVALGTAGIVFLFGALAGDETSTGVQSANNKRFGTGFFITRNGYLITCAHVVEGAHTIKVMTEGGVAAARIISQHDVLDMALLKIDGSGVPLSFFKASSLGIGEMVSTMGYPNIDVQGVEPKYTQGHISALSGPQDDPSCVQISIPLASGYSGAPVVDRNGNVVGLATMLLDGSFAANVAYATKGELVFMFVLKAINEHGLTDLEMPRARFEQHSDIPGLLRDAVTLVFADGSEIVQ